LKDRTHSSHNILLIIFDMVRPKLFYANRNVSAIFGYLHVNVAL